MKNFKTNPGILIAILVFILPWSTSYALENFQKAGVIYSVGYDEFTIRTQKFRFAPGAVIHSTDTKRSKFSDFRRGDYIYFEGVVLDGVYQVNAIHYQNLPPN